MILTDPGRRAALARAAAAHGRPDAADRVVTEIMAVAAPGPAAV
jgi:UDP-N-acetylglucosamine--N-acetylmuramyl-(pentapeptide) pyrophosphoryl-undecaprenol N-acetylglucosamine transferase